MSDYIFLPVSIIDELANDAMERGMTIRAYLNYICEKYISEVLYLHDIGIEKGEAPVQWYPSEKLQSDISVAMSKLNVSEKAVVMECIKYYRKERS